MSPRSKNILAVTALVGACVYPAWNLTIAELSDATDASTTTLFQPELLIQAWGSSIVQIAIGIFGWINRNSNQ